LFSISLLFLKSNIICYYSLLIIYAE
jgi:hypothetical protein